VSRALRFAQDDGLSEGELEQQVLRPLRFAQDDGLSRVLRFVQDDGLGEVLFDAEEGASVCG
jgi:hypothetical protein